MRGRKYTPEQIIGKLREADVELGKGVKLPEVCRKVGIHEQTYYRWKKEFGGLQLEQANGS